MRMFFGIILGIVLTIGAAYIYDSVRKPSGGDGTYDRPIVNWDVLGHTLSSTVQDGWARLTGKSKDSN
jgi:hypothetical protein